MCRSLNLVKFWHWSKILDHKICNVRTSFLVILGTDISGKTGNVQTNLMQVQDYVHTDRLEEEEWMFEDLSPCLNSLEVSSFCHFTLGKILWELRNDLSHDLDTLKDIY